MKLLRRFECTLTGRSIQGHQRDQNECNSRIEVLAIRKLVNNLFHEVKLRRET